MFRISNIGRHVANISVLYNDKATPCRVIEKSGSSAFKKAVDSFTKRSNQANFASVRDQECKLTYYHGKRSGLYEVKILSDGTIQKTNVDPMNAKFQETRLYRAIFNNGQIVRVKKTYVDAMGKLTQLKDVTPKRTQRMIPSDQSNFIIPKKSKFKWASEDRYMISSDSSERICIGGYVRQARHSIPESNVIRNFKSSSSSSNELSHLTMKSKLNLEGHGDKQQFEKFTPAELALELKKRGLKEVGVIKISACNLGRGDFPEKFKAELTKQNIKVGYIATMKGLYSDWSVAVKIFGKKFVLGLGQGVAPYKCFPSLPATWMTRVTKGNVKGVKFFGTRYC